jgi:hypothetical protein
MGVASTSEKAIARTATTADRAQGSRPGRDYRDG